MEEDFGWKFGLDENGSKLFVCIFPPLMFMLGGAWVLYFGISSYYSDLEFGILDEEDLYEIMMDDVLIGSIVLGIGLTLLIVLCSIRALYKSGFFSVYGFTYDHETKMLSVHNGHRKREFYIGDLVKVKVNTTMLDRTSYNNGIFKFVKTPYGFVKVCYMHKGRKKWLTPFGLIDSAESTGDYINYLYEQEMIAKQKQEII